MTDSLPTEELRALAEKYAEALRAADLVTLKEIVGELAGWVPALLDEVEQLREAVRLGWACWPDGTVRTNDITCHPGTEVRDSIASLLGASDPGKEE